MILVPDFTDSCIKSDLYRFSINFLAPHVWSVGEELAVAWEGFYIVCYKSVVDCINVLTIIIKYCFWLLGDFFFLLFFFPEPWLLLI